MKSNRVIKVFSKNKILKKEFIRENKFSRKTEFLRKSVVFIVTISMILGMAGCGKTTEKEDNYRLKIVTSLFPYYDMARAGIILYGLYPSDEVDFSNLELTPAMSWYSHVVNIMEPEMERGVSYGATYVVDHPCRLATVSVGYADGYARSLSNKGWVLIHGQKAPIVGRVCMDQMMVDITDITDVKLEDTVTLIGKDGDNYISVEDMANLAGSFNYEFVCDVGKRVPRVYIK